MKVWDISKSKPTCISETEAKIGMVHALDGCPDAPFVFAFGGDTPSHNMHVMDVRESAKGKINNLVINLLPLFLSDKISAEIFTLKMFVQCWGLTYTSSLYLVILRQILQLVKFS